MPDGISKAVARIGLYASFDHMTCLSPKVTGSQDRPSSRKLGSPATLVSKSNETGPDGEDLSVTQTWLQPSEPSNSRFPPIARPLL